jgi:hypothetical protein
MDKEMNLGVLFIPFFLSVLLRTIATVPSYSMST